MSENLAIINHRQRGYEAALRDHGLPMNKNLLIYCNNNETDNHSLIYRILKREDRPDGMVGSVEKLSTTVYTVCNELNLRIPQDVKVIGFSSLQIASLLNPSMTTITQPAFEMGKTAARYLFEALEKKPQDVKAETIVIPSVLFERGSTQNF